MKVCYMENSHTVEKLFKRFGAAMNDCSSLSHPPLGLAIKNFSPLGNSEVWEL